MSERMFRNEPCWCGSGRKWKNCHRNREEQPRLGLQEVITGVRDAYSAKYCLHPTKAECSGNIIRAHTLQRNGCLSKIAKGGRVYTFKDNNVADIKKVDGVLAPKLVGVLSASTFTGLCGHHDNKLFEPIEKYPFVSSTHHVFLLAYRHLCMEVFTKRAAMETAPLFRSMDRGRPHPLQQMLQGFADDMFRGMRAGLKDAEKVKDGYDKALVAGDFSAMKYYVVRINETPEVMCCGGFFPTHDFDGNVLQTLDDPAVTPGHLAFSIIATNVGGAIVLGWLGDNPAGEALVKSLHTQADADVPHSAVRFMFEFFENNYLSPAWWDGLPEDTRMAIRKRVSKAADLEDVRADGCLKDDGLKVVNWTVAGRDTNLTL